MMSVNVGLCEIALIMSENAGYECMSSPQLLYWVMKVMMWCANDYFGMDVYEWWRINGATSEGMREGFPCPSFENWKKYPNIGKKSPDSVSPWIKCSSMLSFKILF